MRPNLLLLVAVICWVVFPARAEFRAGIAVRIVTPDPLLPVTGGMGGSNPVTNKLGELTVRALVCERGGVRVAFVSTDFLGFPGVLGERVRRLVTVVPGENILIGATHTHSAPDTYGFTDEKGRVATDLKYLEHVVQEAAAAVNEAVTALRPARLKIATGEARGKIAYNYYAPELYDPRVGVIQAVGADDRAFATLVNYAIHPEVLGSRQGVCSPDLIGPLYDRIAEQGGGIGIFMNSAQGGMVTADTRRAGGGENNDWPECQRIGRLLADEALRLVQPAPLQVDPLLHVDAQEVQFPVEAPVMQAVLRSSPLGYKTTPDGFVITRVNLVNLGDAQILTIPGEALPNIGYFLKRKMRGHHNFLFGLTNDAFGYILTPVDWDSFKVYGYVTRTSLGEHTGEILIREALKLIAENPVPAR